MLKFPAKMFTPTANYAMQTFINIFGSCSVYEFDNTLTITTQAQYHIEFPQILDVVKSSELGGFELCFSYNPDLDGIDISTSVKKGT